MTTRALPRQASGLAHRPSLVLMDHVVLALARVHEICGSGRITLAAMLAARMTGPVMVIRPGWGSEQVNGVALREFADPGRFLFVSPQRPEDILWSMEEALRSGAVPLVIAEVTAPPGLTPVRRLHLAAETGAGQGRGRPLGLLLTPGDGGAQGIESRWHMAPALPQGWHLSRRRARAEPPCDWHMLPATDDAPARLIPRSATLPT